MFRENTCSARSSSSNGVPSFTITVNDTIIQDYSNSSSTVAMTATDTCKQNMQRLGEGLLGLDFCMGETT